jgi:hypothetical protein
MRKDFTVPPGNASDPPVVLAVVHVAGSPRIREPLDQRRLSQRLGLSAPRPRQEGQEQDRKDPGQEQKGQEQEEEEETETEDGCDCPSCKLRLTTEEAKGLLLQDAVLPVCQGW